MRNLLLFFPLFVGLWNFCMGAGTVNYNFFPQTNNEINSLNSHSALLLGGYLHLIGGFSTTRTNTIPQENRIFLFNGSDFATSQGSYLISNGKNSHVSVVMQGTMYNLGGLNGTNFMGLPVLVDPILKNSSISTNPIFPRYGASVCTIFNQNLAFGGRDTSGSPANDLIQITPSGVNLVPMGVIKPNIRALHTANCINNTRMIVFGGETNDFIYYADIWILQNTTGGLYWTQLNPSGSGPIGRSGHTAVVTGGNLVIFGGYRRSTNTGDVGTFLNDIVVYDISTNGWLSTSRSTTNGYTPTPRARHTAFLASPTRIVIHGGIGGNSGAPGTAFFEPFVIDLNPITTTAQATTSFFTTGLRTTAMQTTSVATTNNGGVFSCIFNSDCNDYQDCTVDRCVLTVCQNDPKPNGTSCNDGLFCNGNNDRCFNGVCEGNSNPCAGLPTCQSSCDEVHDTCTQTAGFRCEDGLFCTSQDTCNGNGTCVGGPSPCPSNDPCKRCDEVANRCVSPLGTTCDDGLWCNGLDSCNSTGYCVPVVTYNVSRCDGNDECQTYCDEVQDVCQDPAGTPCSTDNNQCTYDQCNGYGMCVHSPAEGQSCSLGEACMANEVCRGTMCVGTFVCSCVQDTDCNDQNNCTRDTCNITSGSCVFTPLDSTPCDDGQWCNGIDYCVTGFCSGHSGNPCNSSNSCQSTCNELDQNCLTPNYTPCQSNGLYCDGEEYCLNGTCVSAGDPCATETETCKRTCNETLMLCASPLGLSCSNGVFCDGLETCDGFGLCLSPGNPCLDQGPCNSTCNENTTTCYASFGTLCDDGIYCNGFDYCNGNGTCLHSSNPCRDQPDPCYQGCNETSQTCISPKGYSCDDGILCNGRETCDGFGVCIYPNADPCPSLSKVSNSKCACDVGLDQCNANCFGVDNGLLQESYIPIAGAVVGAILFCCIVGVVVIVVLWRRSKKAQKALVKQNVDRASSTLELQSITQLQNIEIKNKLGGGNFGDVYYGVWNDETPVACKKLKDEGHFEEFSKEANTLSSLSHPNIVQLLGLYVDPKNGEKYIVTEFLSKGSLFDLLRSEKDAQSLKLPQLLRIMVQACSGMVYLNDKKIIHRDLAARNVLVNKTDTGFVAKIADFGLAKLNQTASYYKSTDREIPVKWSAIETITHGKYSQKSDVWAFGVMMWEILEKGATPYYHLTNKQTVEAVKNGERLSRPSECPEDLWKLMLRCWDADPTKRPDFTEILSELKRILGKEDPQSTEVHNVQAFASAKISLNPYDAIYNNLDTNALVKARVISDYEVQKPGDIGLSRGEIVTIIAEDGEETLVDRSGFRGTAPTKFLQKLAGDESLYN